MSAVSFEVSTSERLLIQAIVGRAMKLRDGRRKVFTDSLSLSMDITAAHANGNPLRLADLVDADEFNFTHDVCGISEHIDRETGQLMHSFRPRFSVPVRVAS